MLRMSRAAPSRVVSIFRLNHGINQEARLNTALCSVPFLRIFRKLLHRSSVAPEPSFLHPNPILFKSAGLILFCASVKSAVCCLLFPGHLSLTLRSDLAHPVNIFPPLIRKIFAAKLYDSFSNPF